ncbi:transcriptional regulator [Sphaerisporangium siamense]|uniref:Transcriptional regulator with XRE-family HTH domain n=1 Tax=Sphaerisporangium siamense TaxID=795645 RepID=A0A7W7DCH3_9ACTN|nr:helix-turn-helix transcriptional regulator [Sphaerisporangium siamense]MBB4704252.1 transcriptional regulator with XRE-family HTH domain [Sphaerisporangium siamense]GII85066.1 transcriptional regulator [Sphaerisporangium siamense]
MSAKFAMTLRAQWLGRQLRELREAAGLTLKEAGAFIQRDSGTISRFEAGIYPARTPDVSALLDLYGVVAPLRRRGLMRLAGEVWQSGWWDAYSEDLSRIVVDYAWVESRASGISSFDALVIPGILQTRGYMEVIMSCAGNGCSSQVDRGVEFRLERQKVLAEHEPPSIVAVLDESILHRVIGDAHIHAEQLDHLLALSEYSHIDIRVLPFASGGHASHEGPFRIFELPDPYPEIAYVETAAGGLYVEGDQVRPLMLRFDRLMRECHGSMESVGMIDAAIRRLRSSKTEART